MITQAEHHQRRLALFAKMETNSIALIPSADIMVRNGFDNDHSFRQSSDFLYLTGFNEPRAVLVLVRGPQENETLLFNQSKNPAEEVWTGFRVGQEGACDRFGVDQAFPIESFEKQLPDLLAGQSMLYFPVGRDMTFDRKVLKAFHKVQHRVRRGVVAPDQFINLEKLLHPMRLIKSDTELDAMRHINAISSEAHVQAMKACRPGSFEHQLEAAMQHHCHQQGARHLAYNAIVGGGKHTCILHYNENNRELLDGDLVLVDMGGEYQGYASDITRTYPVNGSFTGEQRAVYEAVLHAQNELINMIRPIHRWSDVQEASVRLLTQGMLDIGLLKGSLEEIIESGTYKEFYMHLFGHWLGLDTHDVGLYVEGGESMFFKPGMVTTVEPGIYVSEGSSADERWWNIGVRIEDNIIVTDSDPENMTTAPKSIDAIGALWA